MPTELIVDSKGKKKPYQTQAPSKLMIMVGQDDKQRIE